MALSVALKATLLHLADVDLHYDEAQYWEWAQRLDWSYYSKGPLLAWLIAAAQFLFGHGEWQVRISAWLIYGAWLGLLFAFTLDVWQQRRAAWWAVALGLTTPVYALLGLVMTSDVFLFFFWTWALWAMYRALQRAQHRAWYEVGAAVGLGALAKLSIGLLPAIVGIAVLLYPPWRRVLSNPHVWGGLVLMLLLMSPLLIWNAQHDWVMLRHEAGHVHMGETPTLRRVYEFIAGQTLALSPLVVLVGVTLLWRWPRTLDERFLWGVSLVCVGFFLFKATGSKIQPNWPAPAYIGLGIILAGHLVHARVWQQRLVQLGMALSVLMLCLALFPRVLGLSEKQDPLRFAKGWQLAVTEVAARVPDAQFVLAATYHLAGEAAFYWPYAVPVYVVGDERRRRDQHDLWPGPAREVGRTGVFISQTGYVPPELARAFAHCDASFIVPIGRVGEGLYRQFHAVRCVGYRPITWPIPTAY